MNFGQANIVQELCIYVEDVKQLIINCKAVKNFDGSILCAKHPAGKFWEFRISESAFAGYPHLS